jgi:orotidine-5'-phosphate decarboxylase
MPAESFPTRLAAAVAKRGALCVGIDPHPELLRAWELPQDASGLRRFVEICLDAFGTSVAIVKPQSALFEEYGSEGIAVLEFLLAELRSSETLSLLDVKRGDIGSTMSAYARAYLGDGLLAADAITVSPYLGFGSLQPAFDLAERHGRGVFVLARTSNPEGVHLQRHVAQSIIDSAAKLPYVGLVIGATVDLTELDLSNFHGPILAPGYGAQGAGKPEITALQAATPGTILPTTSREILRQGPSVAALQAAVAAAAI